MILITDIKEEKEERRRRRRRREDKGTGREEGRERGT